MDEKQIRVTVSGAPGVGKTAVIELIARCLNEAGIPAVFDPNSLNIKEETKAGITTGEMLQRLESIKQSGNRLVILEEVGNIEAEALVKLLEISSKDVAEGKTISGEELKERLTEVFSEGKSKLSDLA